MYMINKLKIHLKAKIKEDEREEKEMTRSNVTFELCNHSLDISKDLSVKTTFLTPDY